MVVDGGARFVFGCVCQVCARLMKQEATLTARVRPLQALTGLLKWSIIPIPFRYRVSMGSRYSVTVRNSQSVRSLNSEKEDNLEVGLRVLPTHE